MDASTSTDFKTVSISDDYEFIQYNKHLRLIHSIKDDMYQMNSIIKACNSDKQPTRYMDLKETKEIIKEIGSMQKCTDREIIENRPNLPNILKGYYVHRLLVNHVAIWASPIYAIYIMKLLDDYFEKQRNQLQKQITQMKTRQVGQSPVAAKSCVPKNKEKNYKYMIYMSDVLPDDENDNSDMIELHLVKRNNHTFHTMSKIKNSDKCFFYRENLPVAMTPNEDIKSIVRKEFKGSEYDIKGSSILIYKEHLDLLKEKINEYFNNFQN